MSVLASAVSAAVATYASGKFIQYYKTLQTKQPTDPTTLVPPKFDAALYWLLAIAFAFLSLAAMLAGELWRIACFFTVPVAFLWAWSARRSAVTKLIQIEGGFEYWNNRSAPARVLWTDVRLVGSDGAFRFDVKDGRRVKVTESLVGLRVLAQLVLNNVPSDKLMPLAEGRCNDLLQS
ncbi:MAG: hypothetical protein CMP06_00570 [Xanthomonadales bacterium]|nr:hypothetical protein [Xanthomonadales bacterium]